LALLNSLSDQRTKIFFSSGGMVRTVIGLLQLMVSNGKTIAINIIIIFGL
jgi:hypothetical protein